ncbi:MAG: DNA polymerase III subunit gamma/tau [Pseudomonadales bacterium]
MSYQVLARKYRPSSFSELEGQEHVLRALVNALDNNRLHHAYLFTGTRGVGKTTIARILARCLNCEQGISAQPCGVCGTCVEIAEGRNVDLIEVDAASRTKVEDTRELLDNVQYMPTNSRFKVYLIDEVHMLSTHSFNALLKTLEEPPEHVKFLLATTDPKKLPVTVLSRCLQFNLKNLSPERVVNYLKQILPEEGIEFEEDALWLLGRAADGSMRDALSLTDQAISFGNNAVLESDVKMMLGSIDQGEVYGLIDALVAGDGAALLQRVAQLADHAPDYPGLLAEMLGVLHRVALAHAVPDGLDNSHGDRNKVLALVQQLSAEDTQLYYQIGLIGQRDLPYAPDLKTGFEMILLRMLAFTPEDQGGPEKKSPELAETATDQVALKKKPGLNSPELDKSPELNKSPEPINNSSEPEKTRETATAVSDRGKRKSPEASALLNSLANSQGSQAPQQTVAPQSSEASSVSDDSDVIDFDDGPAASAAPIANLKQSLQSPIPEATNSRAETIEPAPEPTLGSAEEPGPGPENPALKANTTEHQEPEETKRILEHGAVSSPDQENQAAARGDLALTPAHWVDILRQLGLSGVTQTVAANCAMTQASADACSLLLDESHASLWNKNHETRIQKALTAYYGRPIQLTFEVGQGATETPAQIEAQRREDARLEAVEIIQADANVQKIIESFDGTLNTESITARQEKNGT